VPHRLADALHEEHRVVDGQGESDHRGGVRDVLGEGDAEREGAGGAEPAEEGGQSDHQGESVAQSDRRSAEDDADDGTPTFSRAQQVRARQLDELLAVRG
jgi:hypothetical protein